ncbi:MAG: hypothetical protein KGL39_17090 [Patescibacteria group bacterium]|nr:hypothetical protein [Patescibacteria group bacterium]
MVATIPLELDLDPANRKLDTLGKMFESTRKTADTLGTSTGRTAVELDNATRASQRLGSEINIVVQHQEQHNLRLRETIGMLGRATLQAAAIAPLVTGSRASKGAALAGISTLGLQGYGAYRLGKAAVGTKAAQAAAARLGLDAASKGGRFGAAAAKAKDLVSTRGLAAARLAVSIGARFGKINPYVATLTATIGTLTTAAWAADKGLSYLASHGSEGAKQLQQSYRDAVDELKRIVTEPSEVIKEKMEAARSLSQNLMAQIGQQLTESADMATRALTQNVEVELKENFESVTRLTGGFQTFGEAASYAGDQAARSLDHVLYTLSHLLGKEMNWKAIFSGNLGKDDSLSNSLFGKGDALPGIPGVNQKYLDLIEEDKKTEREKARAAAERVNAIRDSLAQSAADQERADKLTALSGIKNIEIAKKTFEWKRAALETAQRQGVLSDSEYQSKLKELEILQKITGELQKRENLDKQARKENLRQITERANYSGDFTEADKAQRDFDKQKEIDERVKGFSPTFDQRQAAGSVAKARERFRQQLEMQYDEDKKAEDSGKRNSNLGAGVESERRQAAAEFQKSIAEQEQKQWRDRKQRLEDFVQAAKISGQQVSEFDKARLQEATQLEAKKKAEVEKNEKELRDLREKDRQREMQAAKNQDERDELYFRHQRERNQEKLEDLRRQTAEKQQAANRQQEVDDRERELQQRKKADQDQAAVQQFRQNGGDEQLQQAFNQLPRGQVLRQIAENRAKANGTNVDDELKRVVQQMNAQEQGKRFVDRDAIRGQQADIERRRQAKIALETDNRSGEVDPLRDRLLQKQYDARNRTLMAKAARDMRGATSQGQRDKIAENLVTQQGNLDEEFNQKRRDAVQNRGLDPLRRKAINDQFAKQQQQVGQQARRGDFGGQVGQDEIVKAQGDVLGKNLQNMAQRGVVDGKVIGLLGQMTTGLADEKARLEKMNTTLDEMQKTLTLVLNQKK